MTAAGIVLVILDFRIVAFDALPDVAGWLLVGAGAWRLSLRVPFALAVVAALAAAADVVALYHYESTAPFLKRWFPTAYALTNPTPGLVFPDRFEFDQLTGLRFALALLAMVAGGLGLWSLLGTLRDRARAAGAEDASGRLTIARWSVMVVWTAPYVGVAISQADGAGFDPVWNGGHEIVALVGLIVVAITAWLLVIYNNRVWSAPAGGSINPWAEMMANRRSRP